MNVPEKYIFALIGLLCGFAIAAVDNFAFGGEISPIVIVVLLFGVAAVSATVISKRARLLVFFSWFCVPAAHLLKHILNMPDTLQPNTYSSILQLAAFTFFVSVFGFTIGLLINRLIKSN